MSNIKWFRFRQIIKFGWKDAKEIAAFEGVKKSRITLFLDIISCFRNYYVFSNQYKRNKLWALFANERLEIVEKIGATNKKKDDWLDRHYADWNFLSKYTGFEWQRTPEKINKRKEAYRIHYGLGENVSVQYGVTFICEHYLIGKITCGNNVHFARNVDIDYTGDLTIGNNVFFSEGVKVFTHNHSIGFDKSNYEKSCIITPLTLQDNVWIGARAVIMPGVREIGRGAIISAGSFVNSKIPPYAIVMGNPAKIVGFKKSPEEILEYERGQYEEKNSISEEIIYGNYDKYFRKRWKEIKQWSRL